MEPDSGNDGSSSAGPTSRAQPEDLVTVLSQKVVGQPAAMSVIAPYVDMYRANLAPEGRPVGIFLLLGPTGTGKTRTVEALAEILHGSARNVVKINCGEYQMDHEVAKLIGAPPGYVGHRESQPAITQARLNEAASAQCDLSLVLFDEVEKAAPSLTRLLLGMLDKAVLQLGDGATVNFERSMIFLTSNLGAEQMSKEMSPHLGFQREAPGHGELVHRLEAVALAAVRKRFSPEFINRIDAVVTYHPLAEASLTAILDQHIAELQHHVNARLGHRCFQIEVSAESRRFLLRKGTSPEYGARELKRTIHRHLTQPLATLVARSQVAPGSLVRVESQEGVDGLILRASGPVAAARAAIHAVLLVDDNHDLLGFLRELMRPSGWIILTAETAAAARELAQQQKADAALLDYMLPDGNGLDLALELRRNDPEMHIVLMTGGLLASEEKSVCERWRIPVLQKPFLPDEVMELLRSRAQKSRAAVA
jgi:CheY-like chemotaxis protein